MYGCVWVRYVCVAISQARTKELRTQRPSRKLPLPSRRPVPTPHADQDLASAGAKLALPRPKAGEIISLSKSMKAITTRNTVTWRHQRVLQAMQY